MKLTISTSAARAAALVAIAARVFLALAVDAPATHNGAWLSALIGGLLAAPWLLCVGYLRQRARTFAPLSAALAALTVLDAAVVVSAVARSAGYLALDRLPSLAPLLPVGVAVLWCVWRNGDAIGYGAMLWTRIGLALLVGIALLQGRFLRAAWLRPLLGSGWREIIDGGISAAGSIVAAAAVLPLSDGKGARRQPSLLTMLAFAVAVAAALLLLRLMMTPTQLNGNGWLNRLDSLLCNGRSPLYLQLPMIVAWFAGLMHLLACECFAAAAHLQRLCDRLDGRVCGLLTLAAILPLSRAENLAALYGAVSRWSFVGVGGLTALALALPSKAKGGAARCAPEC